MRLSQDVLVLGNNYHPRKLLGNCSMATPWLRHWTIFVRVKSEKELCINRFRECFIDIEVELTELLAFN